MTDQEKERWKQDSIMLNQVGWKLCLALGYANEGDVEAEGVNILEMLDELIMKANREDDGE